MPVAKMVMITCPVHKKPVPTMIAYTPEDWDPVKLENMGAGCPHCGPGIIHKYDGFNAYLDGDKPKQPPLR